MILGSKRPEDKPLFWGEIGSPNDEDQGELERHVIRAGIWDGVLAGDQGSGEYWNWERIAKNPTWYAEYKLASSIIRSSGLMSQRNATSLTLKLDTPLGAPLSFAPGMGWGASSQFVFNLPDDAGPSVMGKLSEYLQGRAHPELGKNRWEFAFKAKQPGTFFVKIAGVADSGAELHVELNGKPLKSEEFAAGSHVTETWEFPFQTGTNRLVLTNTGQDWVRMGGFSATGLAPVVRGSALASGSWAIMRLRRADGLPPSWTATNLPLTDGSYKMTIWDLDTGGSVTNSVTVTGGRVGQLDMSPKDEIAVLRKQ
jgi:hypothetical protein